jgi:hypothetical protein
MTEARDPKNFTSYLIGTRQKEKQPNYEVRLHPFLDLLLLSPKFETKRKG